MKEKYLTAFKYILLSVTFMLMISVLQAQPELIISGRTYTNTDDTWLGVNIPRSSPTMLIFRNNSITSENRFGYMLQAGDENQASSNNNLDGAIITGNRLTWNGSDMEVIPHGIFTGHNSNVLIKYNYLSQVPMGIIRKSTTNMDNDRGGVAYNIVKGGAVGVVIKGMSGVNIFNNTFYSDRTREQTWRPLVHIYTNTDDGLYSVSHNTRIYNNIFYTKYGTPVITIADQESFNGFECDYNIYWSEAGPPRFVVNESEISFEQWQAMGYDTHSRVMNPGFRDFVNFVPESRLDYGTDLGDEWSDGLSPDATWGASDPATALQSGKWQVGAVVLPGENPGDQSEPIHVQSVISDSTPPVIRMTYNTALANIIPPVSAFRVYVNSQLAVIHEISILGKEVLITLSTSVHHGDEITIVYIKPSENPIQTESGIQAATLNTHPVINNILSESNKIKIFPNPAKTFFNIANIGSDNLPQVIRIFDISGKLRFEKILDTEFLYKVPVNLRPGIYILSVQLGSEVDHRQKLVIIE